MDVSLVNQEELSEEVRCESATVHQSSPAASRQGLRQREGENLASTFESHTSSVHSRVNTQRLTLESLPEEIILDVLGHDDSSGCLSKPPRDLQVPDRDLRLKSLLRYSHICSRLRTIILSLHSLWAAIPLGLSLALHLIETIVHGSGALGLTVSLDLGYDADNEQFYTAITKGIGKRLPVSSDSVLAALAKIYDHCERWESAVFAVRDSRSAEYIQEVFCHANPISLRTLKVEGISGKPGTCLYHKWTMPQLEDLCWKIYDILPLSTIPKLRICALHQEEPKLGDIIAFLTSTPSVTSLTLDLQRSFRPEGAVEHQVVDVPNLEQLDLRFGHSSVETIVRILDVILCPRLKYLCFRTYRHAAFLDLVHRIKECRYPLLNSVNLDISWLDDQYDQQVVYLEDDILCSLPTTIEKVKLSGSSELRSSRRGGIVHHKEPIPYPHLKELDLIDCTSPLEDGFFANLSDVLSRYGVVLDHFQPAGKWALRVDYPSASFSTTVFKRQVYGTIEQNKLIFPSYLPFSAGVGTLSEMIPRYFHETRETIDLLRRIVDKLDEKDGCIGAEELWDGVQCKPADVGSFDPTIARQGMRQMKGLLIGLQSFVSTLASTFDSHISSTRAHFGVKRLTLESLPNELVLRVLEDTYDHWDLTSLVRYSTISSRFRTIILDSPSLWASIKLTLTMPICHIETIALRSATLRLTVAITIGHHTRINNSVTAFYMASETQYQPVPSTSILATLEKLFEYSHRWRDVQITIKDEGTAQFIEEHFPRAILTSIRTFRFDSDDSDVRWIMNINVLENWEMPYLETLYWGHPCICPPSCASTQTLRACTLWTSELQLMGISAFLGSAPNLTSVQLYLVRKPDSDLVVSAALPLTRLSCLETLKLHDFCRPRSGAITHLLKAILCPGLKYLCFPAKTHADYLDSTEKMRERYPFLHSVTLYIGWGDNQEQNVDNLLCSLPSTIQKVQLRGGYGAKLHASCTISNSLCTSLPNLKDLDLEDCAAREESFYADLSDTLKRLRVTLHHFRPCWHSWTETRIEKDNAMKTLRRAGVLVDMNSTS